MSDPTHGEILARLDERTKGLPETLGEIRDEQKKQGEQIATNTEAIKGTRKLAAIISGAIGSAVAAANALIPGGS